ncbi:MAG TPA: MarR family transcriptional regulator [Longimicrobiales bacterium]|nr:MarR family transcriptional regulator [Longimicrobiales bacterium]
MTRPIQYYIRQQRGFRTLEEEVFVGLQLAADRLMAPWERTLRERADLTPVQYNVLRILRGAGAEGLWAGEIAARLIARSPDVTRLVDRLEKRGLVSRCRDAVDGRAVRVHITAAGLERIGPLDEHVRTELHDVLGGLGEARLATLKDALEAVLASVESRS